MAMMSDAVNKIRGIASSYLSHPAMLRAKQVASQIARNPNVRMGAFIGGGLGSLATLPGVVGGYRRNRSMGRGRLDSYARSTAASSAISYGLGGALLGAAGYGGYKALGGYGGMKSAAWGAGIKATRWGSGVLGKMASMIE